MKRDFLEQMELDKDVIDKIMAEHGKTVQAAKPEDYDTLKAQATTDAATIKELEGKLATSQGDETKLNELQSRVKAYEHNELKLKVARDNNIPFDLAQRLTGETEEDLTADAKSLSSFVTKADVFPLKNTDSTVDTENEAYKNMLKDLD